MSGQNLEVEKNSVPSPVEKKRSRLPLYFVVMLALILAVAALILQLQNTSFKRVAQHQGAGLEAAVASLNSSLAEQQKFLDGLKDTMKNEDLFSKHRQQMEVLTSAYYLIKTAEVALLSDIDTKGALKNLQQAKQLLVTIDADPLILDAAKALDQDSATLRDFTVLDTAQISGQIDALSETVAGLSLVADTSRQQAKPNEKSTKQDLDKNTSAKELPFWRSIYNSIGDLLQQAVIVRHQEESFAPLLTPQLENLMINKMQSKLLLAEWALLHKQSALYQQSLNAVAAILQKNFAQYPTKQLQLLHAQIATLQAIKVDQKNPQLDASEEAVNRALQQLLLSKNGFLAPLQRFLPQS